MDILAAGVSCNLQPMAWSANTAVLRQALQACQSQHVAIACFAELNLCSYDCQDAFYWPMMADKAQSMVRDLLPMTAGMVVSFGLPVWYQGVCYNSTILIVDGRPIGIACKQHLANDGVHYEPRWFSPWPADQVGQIDFGGDVLPIGDLRFDVGGVSIGYEICQEAWEAERRAKHLLADGVQVILNPSASHFAIGKHDKRCQLVQEIIETSSAAYVFVNQLGNIAGRLIYDGDVIFGQNGQLSTNARFSYADYTLHTASIAVDSKAYPTTDKWVKCDYDWPQTAVAADFVQAGTLPAFEEVTQAVALGLFDLLRKTGTTGFVVSLSGGMDSGACAILVFAMREYARQALGADWHDALPAWQDKPEPKMADMLSCLYQRTDNSSDVTEQAASDIAVAIGAQYGAVEVQSMVDDYCALTEQVIGRQLSWAQDDIALQNIQARVRAPSAWMIANVKQALLLATNNRSEGAMGYTTMDGDTAGCYCPIAGVDKAFLQRWLAWWQSTGPQKIGPLGVLKAITVQAPTAELRPLTERQTDEADLMPYAIIEAIGHLLWVQRCAPDSLHTQLSELYPQMDGADLSGYIDKYTKLWARNQWKRERLAPAFHLNDYSVCPKTALRYPILSAPMA